RRRGPPRPDGAAARVRPARRPDHHRWPERVARPGRTGAGGVARRRRGGGRRPARPGVGPTRDGGGRAGRPRRPALPGGPARGRQGRARPLLRATVAGAGLVAAPHRARQGATGGAALLSAHPARRGGRRAGLGGPGPGPGSAGAWYPAAGDLVGDDAHPAVLGALGPGPQAGVLGGEDVLDGSHLERTPVHDHAPAATSVDVVFVDLECYRRLEERIGEL